MAMHVHHETVAHAVEALKLPTSHAVGGDDEAKDAGASAPVAAETEAQMRGLISDFEHSAQDLKIAFNYLEEKQTIDSLMQVHRRRPQTCHEVGVPCWAEPGGARWQQVQWRRGRGG